MPSEPIGEPTIEQLSAFLDHELDPASQSAVAGHVATCAECQARLENLRQTAYAIRGLPMETPPRTFAVPPERSARRWNWAPAGWIGGTAVAMLVVVVGVSHLHFTGGGATAASSSSNSAAHPPQALYAQQQSRDGAGAVAAPKQNAAPNQATAVDATNPGRRLTLITDSGTYQATGTMTVQIYFNGFNPGQAPPLQLWLERNGYAVELLAPSQSTPGPGGVQGQYALSTLQLPSPIGGSYTLTVVQPLPGNPATLLVARLPITVTG